MPATNNPDTIQIKRRASSNAAGSPPSLKSGEIAYNENDNTLYYGYGDNGSSVATSIIAISGKGAFIDLTSAQSAAGVKTFTASPIVPTVASGDSSQKAASTAFVANAIGNAGGNQNPNTVLAGPASGSTAAAPSYRALVPLDIPTLTTSKLSDFVSAVGSLISAQGGVVGGFAPLDSNKLVPAAYLPSYVDDVMEVANFASLPATGSNFVIYVTQDTNKIYRWSGTAYIEISPSPGSSDAVPEGTQNLYFQATRVLATVIAGLSTSSSAVISNTDTVLSAFGKLQAQISAFGTMAQQNANAVNISGGSIQGVTMDCGTF